MHREQCCREYTIYLYVRSPDALIALQTQVHTFTATKLYSSQEDAQKNHSEPYA